MDPVHATAVAAISPGSTDTSASVGASPMPLVDTPLTPSITFYTPPATFRAPLATSPMPSTTFPTPPTTFSIPPATFTPLTTLPVLPVTFPMPTTTLPASSASTTYGDLTVETPVKKGSIQTLQTQSDVARSGSMVTTKEEKNKKKQLGPEPDAIVTV